MHLLRLEEDATEDSQHQQNGSKAVAILGPTGPKLDMLGPSNFSQGLDYLNKTRQDQSNGSMTLTYKKGSCPLTR